MTHLERGRHRLWAILTLLLLFASPLTPLVVAVEAEATPVVESPPAPVVAVNDGEVIPLPPVPDPVAEGDPAERLPEAAPESSDSPEDREADRSMAITATDPVYTSIVMTLTESTGRVMRFPDAGTICLAIDIAPDHVAESALRPCFDAVEGFRQWDGRPEDPFLMSSAYTASVLSNTTACTVAVPAMTEFEATPGFPQAIFHVSITCAEGPGTEPEMLDELWLRYTDGGAPETLPGEICVLIDVAPTPIRAPLESCTTRAVEIDSWAGTATEPLPRASTYTANVVSNASGCLAIPGSMTVTVTSTARVIGTIPVRIDCGPPWSSGTHEYLRVIFANDGTAPANLAGPICIGLVTDPPDYFHTPGACTSQADRSMSVSTGTGPRLPRTATYTATIDRNESGCSATPQPFQEVPLSGGVYIAEMVIIVSCAPAEPPVPDQYAELLLVFSDVETGVFAYPGDLCVDVTVDPPTTGGALIGSYCANESPATITWNSTSDAIDLPLSGTYTATVTSNATRCVATPDTGVVREVFPHGTYGRLVVRIDCPAPTVDSYAGISITLTDSTGVDRTYDGEICIDVAITPDVSIPGAGPQCFTSSYAQSGYAARGAILPTTSTYDGVIVSNATGCTATWTSHEEAVGPVVPVDPGDGRIEILSDGFSPLTGPVMIVIDVILDCDDPAGEPDGDLFQVGIAFSDVRDADVAYPGDVCVEVLVDPVAGATTTVPYCTDSAFRYHLLPGDDWSHLSTTTYTTTLVSNATGCEVTIDPYRLFTGPLAPPLGHIQVWVDCDPPEEPEPAGTPPVDDTPTVVPGETPRVDDTPVPTEAAKTRTGGEPSTTAVVTRLPTTGTGEREHTGEHVEWIVPGTIGIAGAIIAALVRSGAVGVGVRPHRATYLSRARRS